MRIFPFRAALPLALLTAVCAPASRAQQDAPSFSNDDVAPPPIVAPADPAPAATPAEMTAMAGGLRAGVLDGILEALPPDAAPLRDRIRAGGEVGLAVRFNVSPAGRPEQVVLERGTGVPAVDRKILESFTKDFTPPRGAPTADVLAGCNNYRVELALSRARLLADISLDAASPARAAELEEQANAHLVVFRTYLKGDADMDRLLRSVRMTRQGVRLGLTANLDMALLERIAAKQRPR
jgi:hypothetical protein